ncbi:MAG: hypothetical protein QW407_04070 [Thermofilaceae archaeon]
MRRSGVFKVKAGVWKASNSRRMDVELVAGSESSSLFCPLR